MTTEHKLLTLLDRGVSAESDVDGILAELECYEYVLSSMLVTRRIERIDGHLRLTPRGVERLNDLDEAAA